MNTKQIRFALEKNPITSPVFRGVFAADQLPVPHYTSPSAYVANCSNADSGGTHWSAFYQDDPSIMEVFDSYGKPLDFYNPHLLSFTHGLQQIRQVQALQQPLSTVCGQYCLYFLFNRCSGESYSQLIHSFTDNPLINDKIVCQYVNQCFDLKTRVFDLSLLDQSARAMVRNIRTNS